MLVELLQNTTGLVAHRFADFQRPQRPPSTLKSSGKVRFVTNFHMITESKRRVLSDVNPQTTRRRCKHSRGGIRGFLSFPNQPESERELQISAFFADRIQKLFIATFNKI